MAYKFLRGTLLVGSAGATLTGAYTSYDANLSVADIKPEEKPNNGEIEMPSGSEIKPEQADAQTPDAVVPDAVTDPSPNADRETPASEPTETQNQESSPSTPKKDGKEELVKWIEEDEKLKALSYKISKGDDYKDVKDSAISDSDVEGLKAFLEQEKAKGLDSTVNKEIRLKQSDGKTWSVENEAYKAKRLITDKFATDGRQCTFKFKPKDSNEYKGIDELTDEQATGLSDFLEQDLKNNSNSICPKLGGGSRAPGGSPNEEKIKYEESKWQRHESGDE